MKRKITTYILLICTVGIYLYVYVNIKKYTETSYTTVSFSSNTNKNTEKEMNVETKSTASTTVKSQTKKVEPQKILKIPLEFQENGIESIEYTSALKYMKEKDKTLVSQRKKMWNELTTRVYEKIICEEEDKNTTACVEAIMSGSCGKYKIWVKKEFQGFGPDFLQEIYRASFSEFPYTVEC